MKHGRQKRSEASIAADDLHALRKMGYAQELARSIGGYSNFAMSMSIICILAGGITSFHVGLATTGGFGIGVGWLAGGLFALIVAFSMAQIASAYPTAGGVYHWASILGGKGWGWTTAWINLLGLIFVVASVNVGIYNLAKDLILDSLFHVDTSSWNAGYQAAAVIAIALSQGVFNHFGIRLTTKLTDFSGILIFVVAAALTLTMLGNIRSANPGKLFHFVNLTGQAGGNVVPHTDSPLLALGLGLLFPLYTFTGFDASAHASEETRNARLSVPRGMINAVLWSVISGYVMTCSFVLAMADPSVSARQGSHVFFSLLAGLQVTAGVKYFIYIGIVLANYLCALAAVTSTSRMVYAFARDGGLPVPLRRVSPIYKTPLAAIWTTVALSIAATLYSPAFDALAAGCAVFLYISYAMPVAAGLFAEGTRWTEFGPFRLGVLSKPLALATVLGVVLICYLGIQPPNDILIHYAVAIPVLLGLGWYFFARQRFTGPPVAGGG